MYLKLTENSNKDGFVIIVIVFYQMHLRCWFLPGLQVLLHTFHKKFRHCGAATTKKEHLIKQKRKEKEATFDSYCPTLSMTCCKQFRTTAKNLSLIDLVIK